MYQGNDFSVGTLKYISVSFFCELISGRTKSDCAVEDWKRLNFSVLLNRPAQSEVVRGALIV